MGCCDRSMIYNSFWNDTISFSILIASTGAGLVLFMGDHYRWLMYVSTASYQHSDIDVSTVYAPLQSVMDVSG